MPDDVVMPLPIGQLIAAKRKRSVTVSMCIPARNEEATVGAVVAASMSTLVAPGLVDEVIVMDHGSADWTAECAARAGAIVVDADSVAAEHGPAIGKGDVMWRSLLASRGDLVVWCDADLQGFDPLMIAGLIGPLLTDPSVELVKGVFTRDTSGRGGGRVTELVARPLLSLLRPDLAWVLQPLGGTTAGRRGVLEAIPFEVDYGVEIGMLIDVAALAGVEAIVQVDLGLIRHRSRHLFDLRDQAAQVSRAILSRSPEAREALVGLGEVTGNSWPTRPPALLSRPSCGASHAAFR